jgi:hypothetical protein
MPAGKRPAFQFYPGDWLRDPAVRSVSLAARGLWTDMLCLMFESDRKGYLCVNGKPVSAAVLARMTGGTTDEVSQLLTELEASGVFSRTEHGMIYSRRMVRDENKRQLCKEAGKRGGNPVLLNGSTLKGHSKGSPRVGVKPKLTPSSSSSSSETSEEVSPPLPPNLDTAEFRSAWEDWLAFRRKKRKPVSEDGGRDTLADLAKYGPEIAVATIRRSIRSDWQGLFPEREGERGKSSPGRKAATLEDLAKLEEEMHRGRST